jgi:hypothetical protein
MGFRVYEKQFKTLEELEGMILVLVEAERNSNAATWESYE